MHPAWSVILFTVLAGAGQGLFLMALRAEALGADPAVLAPAGAASVVLLVAGMACSFFHLGHPMRAWRAVAMWRTSWLSREVIVLPALIASVALWTLAQLAGHAAAGWLGVAGALLCLALWLCTGMIYACLRFLREWAHPLTVVNFTLLGWMSGATLFAAWWWVRVGAAGTPAMIDAAIVLTVLGATGRIASLARNRALKPASTAQSALGMRATKLRQITRGTTARSFNTREFFHGRTAAFVANVRWLALGFAFALPLCLLIAARVAPSGAVLAAAVVSQWAGLFAERWLFFAQANHPQNVFYQAVA